jgi:hypothetical protein
MPNTPIVDAAEKGDLRSVQACLERGDDIEAVDGADAGTALWWAAARGHTRVCELLVEWGASLSALRGGNNPEAIARACSKPETAAMLERAVQQPAGPPQPERWVRLGEDSVAFTGFYRPIEKKLTEIFNFSSRERLTIVENLRSKTDAMTPAVSFDELPERILRKALEEFERLGGKPDRDYVLRGEDGIGKEKKLLPRGAGNG